jgi:hypothetical protein
VLVNCVNRDNGVSLADRNKFFIGQRDCSDEEIISFWLSVSFLEDHRVPMFVVEYTAYLDDVAGGIVGDLGLTLLDFQVYIAALREK